MTNAQLRRLQEKQQEATRIANKKISDAKQTEEWKTEQAILNAIENKLDSDIAKIKGIPDFKEETEEEKKLTLWEKIILWFKNLFR
jgi:hypothetical protein